MKPSCDGSFVEIICAWLLSDREYVESVFIYFAVPYHSLKLSGIREKKRRVGVQESAERSLDCWSNLLKKGSSNI